jgi:hypothetical protein
MSVTRQSCRNRTPSSRRAEDQKLTGPVAFESHAVSFVLVEQRKSSFVEGDESFNAMLEVSALSELSDENATGR